MKRASLTLAFLAIVGMACWYGQPGEVVGQDQTDERLAKLETQVSDQSADIQKLWKHVRALETVVAESDVSASIETPEAATDVITISGSGQQSTDPIELDGAYNVRATCTGGLYFSIDTVNITNPDAFEFVDLFGETPFDSSAIATFDGDRYAFTVGCRGDWELTLTHLS